MKEALVIIDVQNDYFAEGAYPLHKPDNALSHCCQLAQTFVERGETIYFIKHISRSPQSHFFLPGTRGAALHSAFDAFLTYEQATIIEKAYPNSFLRTTLGEDLQQQAIDQLVVCGMMTHMCIDSTTRQARELGYPIKLIADACATRDLVYGEQKMCADDVQRVFLAALTSFAEVIDTENYLRQ